MKLDTTEAVLEWAEGINHCTHMTGDFEADDTETAARLALAMRVLAIVERGAYLYGDSNENWERQLLAEAAKEEGK